MKIARRLVDSVKPHFNKGGRLEKFHPAFDALETFLFVPGRTTADGVHVRDAMDLKRTMFTVIIALVPTLLFGMWNVGYQHYRAFGMETSLIDNFMFGFWKVLPIIVVSYAVGLGVEFVFAIIRNHQISEGYLVTGLLIPLTMPVTIPLWMVALAAVFCTVLGKEVFGGTGMNFMNPALLARAFLFFAFPAYMSGDIWTDLSPEPGHAVLDAWSGATNLVTFDSNYHALSPPSDLFWGFEQGSIGETSVFACLLGALILIVTGVGSGKIIVSCFAGTLLMGLLLNLLAPADLPNHPMHTPAFYHWLMGGFAFGAVYMATDPVSAAQTESGKWIYGLLIGAFTVVLRVFNPAYPEGVMLSILLMNVFAPLIDYIMVEQHIKTASAVHSNRYTLIYAAVLSILTAIVLAAASEGLKPAQEANIALDTKSNILRAVRFYSGERQAIEKEYSKHIREVVLNAAGAEQSGIRTADVALKDEVAKKPEARKLPLYIYTGNEGKPYYVIPMRGVGLWGPIWGYISFENDFNTVYGVFFDHKSETPGLGAEIAELPFQQQFQGKKIRDDNNQFVSVNVVKKTAKINVGNQHRVDAISGGTITSRGTDAMLKNCVAPYLTYFEKLKNKAL